MPEPMVASPPESFASAGSPMLWAFIILTLVGAIAGNIRAIIQDFEYPEDYFKSDFEGRRKIIERLSKRVTAERVRELIGDYVRFHKEAEEKAAKDRFENDVDEMVRQLNAGREAAARAAGLSKL